MIRSLMTLLVVLCATAVNAQSPVDHGRVLFEHDPPAATLSGSGWSPENLTPADRVPADAVVEPTHRSRIGLLDQDAAGSPPCAGCPRRRVGTAFMQATIV